MFQVLLYLNQQSQNNIWTKEIELEFDVKIELSFWPISISSKIKINYTVSMDHTCILDHVNILPLTGLYYTPGVINVHENILSKLP